VEERAAFATIVSLALRGCTLADALGVPVEAFRACLPDEKLAAIHPPTRTAGSTGRMPKRAKNKCFPRAGLVAQRANRPPRANRW
jgi:hypothetical protein